MRRRKLKAGYNPENYPCKNPACTRTTDLALKSYLNWPLLDTPAERVHEVYDPNYPGFSLGCANCGHYTVVSPHPPRGLDDR